MLVVILTCSLLVSFYLLYLSVKRNLEFVSLIESVSDQVEESTELLESCLARIERKSKLEVMFDDPVVKELIEDIKNSKEAVKLVKEKISIAIEESDEKNAS